jgi:Fur family zinc uptake transcriptional regulator
MDGFSMATTALLDKAALICGGRGAKLTALRRLVLGHILEAEAPAGAYDLLERLRASRGPSAPPTVYRALDFLLEQGLVHRVERLSAFIACIEDHGHDHGAQFLICGQCRKVTEIEDRNVDHALRRAAAQAGFSLTGATVEAVGTCADCAVSPAGSSPAS